VLRLGGAVPDADDRAVERERAGDRGGDRVGLVEDSPAGASENASSAIRSTSTVTKRRSSSGTNSVAVSTPCSTSTIHAPCPMLASPKFRQSGDPT
jgi:hypothetical protein